MNNDLIQAEFERLRTTLNKRELAKLADILIVKTGMTSRNPIRSKAAEHYRKQLYGDRAHWPNELAFHPENGE